MMWRATAGWLCTLAACSVQDTRLHCATVYDCAQGEECYVGFCVEGDAGRRTAQLPERAQNPDDAGDGDGGPRPGIDSHVSGAAGSAAPAADGCSKANACYDGPSGTEGVGICHAGQRACDHGVLGPCRDSQLPQAKGEDCNARDDDCDGKVDETFDLQSDPAHCGRCNNVCHTNETCHAGQCEPSAPAASGCGDGLSCAAGSSCCAGQCTDLTQSAASCGACGHKCGTGESCCGGQCVDKQQDPQHCGSCGTKCQQGDLPGCCDGECTDLASNANCGQCGSSCGLLSGALCKCLQEDGTARCRSIFLDLCI